MANFPISENPAFSGTMEQLTNRDRGAFDTFNPRYQILLDNDNYLKAQVMRQDNEAAITLLASSWSATAPYMQRVAVPGLLATDKPSIHPITPKELSPDQVKLRQKFTGMITDGDTEDGYATFYCGIKKPTADFPVLLMGVSANE